MKKIIFTTIKYSAFSLLIANSIYLYIARQNEQQINSYMNNYCLNMNRTQPPPSCFLDSQLIQQIQSLGFCYDDTATLYNIFASKKCQHPLPLSKPIQSIRNYNGHCDNKSHLSQLLIFRTPVNCNSIDISRYKANDMLTFSSQDIGIRFLFTNLSKTTTNDHTEFQATITETYINDTNDPWVYSPQWQLYKSSGTCLLNTDNIICNANLYGRKKGRYSRIYINYKWN